VTVHSGDPVHFSGSVSKWSRDGKVVVSSTLEEGEELITPEAMDKKQNLLMGSTEHPGKGNDGSDEDS
jgi:hypothetical protein